MLLKKIYNAETKTEKAWYDSSMFYYTKAVEHDDTNTVDLYVTFKNGATYVYKNVLLSDYVLLIGGGTDASQGKTLNKIIKPNYDFERVADESIQLLSEEYNRLIEKDSEKWITYFISGHRDITNEEFEYAYAPRIENIIEENPSAKFVVGDYHGVDIMAQNYLIDVLQVNPDNITVYHMGDKPMNINPKITNTVGGFKTDEERDAAMTKNSFEDIAFVRDNTKLSGTAQNILRRNLIF